MDAPHIGQEVPGRAVPSTARADEPFSDLEVFRLILESIPLMVFVKEARDLRLVYFNEATEGIVGRPRSALIGRSDFDLFSREQAERYIAADRAVLASRRALDIPEEPIETARGLRWLHTRKIGIYDDEGNPRFLVGISEDITERREAHQAIEAQRLMLERSARLSAMGELAGSVAHELNTPLGSIALRAEIVARLVEAGQEDAARITKEARAIMSTVERASKIIDGLRRFGRASENEPMQSVSVAELVNDVIELSGSRMKRHGITVQERVAAGLVAWCRPVQIGQVLVNLLNNACDALQPADTRWIEIDATRAGSHVVISVTNSGPPIPEEVRPRLMQPFFTTKALGEGTGLGLTIASRIAREHGGSLEYDASSPHTRFVLTIPSRGDGP